MKLIHEIHHRSQPKKRSQRADVPEQKNEYSSGAVARYAWSEFDIEHTRIGAQPISHALRITTSRIGFAPSKVGVALARAAWSASKANDQPLPKE
jgi:hypothetical protein